MTTYNSLRSRFAWDADALFYPAGHGACAICNGPDLPVVRAFPDTVDPTEVAVCVDCLSDHPDDWAMFGEMVLEWLDVDHHEVDPGYMAYTSLTAPDDWRGVSPGEPEVWDEVLLRFDSDEREVPASRSPFETNTMRRVFIEGPTHVIVDGFELEYDGYTPVNIEAVEERETERANEPPEPEPYDI